MKLTRKANAVKWYGLVEKFKSNGMSRMEFCQVEQLNKHTFQYWYKKYEEQSLSPSEDFVSLSPVSNRGSIFIRYKNGVELELPASFPAEQLIKMIRLG